MLARAKAALKRNNASLSAVRAAYPALNWLRSRRAYYLRVAPYLARMEFDEVRFSNRGNEPESHLRRTNTLARLNGANILVLGAGGGDELALWARQRPQSLTAVDFFGNDVWNGRRDARFVRMDVRALAFADSSFDIVASTALLEHVDGIEECAAEMARVARPGGLVFANFGPLYRTYGGAHYLGAYEHLWMSDEQFESYLLERAIPYERDEALFYLRHGMFSRRTYAEYISALHRHFNIEHLILSVSSDALHFRRQHPLQWRSLRGRYTEEDLLTFAAMVWMRPKLLPHSLPRPVAARAA